eukprot:CAMPEP_0118720140 /NCGR_PEP_ID=MMETSP0800-20121206/29929_1 /TAXON_ID=210618 ORGANISM="Striatella unipunctata, Strain CCMP2910" /NCGR_SAMPLE_ID=MMETSP0800 /ASSEMBLY_ACC=CAM_ASM_000638 /LENGTH=111 /DNA_ID=CAMNT_0006627715 /DNA_START=143 /DNA_END=478 /DNA_ORIENTATION=-
MAISKVGKLGSGVRTLKVGESTMIVSVPTELDQDHMEIMALAQEGGGKVTKEDVMDKTKWKRERTKRALDLLLSQGMAWLDLHRGKETYWVPSIWKEGLDDTMEAGDDDDE